MNAKKIGKLIYDLRIKKNLTQKELAQKINITDKAICKWEKGRGCPDVTLLPLISQYLEVSIENLLRGELEKSQTSGGNMKNLKIYRCKSCRNLITSSNTIDIACCGEKLINLEAIDLEKLPQLEKEKYSPKISEVDQEFFIEFKHPMVKDDFISAVLVVSYDKIAVINMFAEQEASFSLQRIAGVKIFAITSKNLLIKVL